MPVWITETGYDTNHGTRPLLAIGNRSVLQTEADWLLRTALLYARWGVERTFMYQLSDDNPTNPVQFGSSGLINTDHTPKPAADFLRQTAQLFGNFAYKGTLNNDPVVDHYEAPDGRTAYALVVPEEQGRTASYKLSLSGVDTATICRPVSGQASMTTTKVRVQNGQLPLTLTETPTFVLAGTIPVAKAVGATCAGVGSIQWEQWTSSSGAAVATIPVQTAPNATATLTRLESGRSLGSSFGARIRGYLCAPLDGAYQFRISGDDDCQLWRSPDDNPANKILVAGFSGWTDYR